MAERFAIAQVAPHPLEDANEVGTFASEVSKELAARNHRVLLLAPSRNPDLVRESRKLIRSARENPEDLFDADEGSVLCTHRPVLPLVYDAAGLDGSFEERPLEPAEMLVLHVRKGAVVAVERHRPRAAPQ